MVEIDRWLSVLREGNILPERSVRLLCDKVKEILISEANIVQLTAPVTICGDLHG